MCVQVYVHVHVCVHPSSCRFMWCTEAKGRCFPQYFSLHCIWNRRLLNLEVANSDSHDVRWTPGSSCLFLPDPVLQTSPVALSFFTRSLGIEFRPSHFHSKLFTDRAISPASISEFLSTEHISVKVVKVEKGGISNETDIWGLNIRSYIFSKTKCHIGSLPGQGWGGLIIHIEISGKKMFQMALSLSYLAPRWIWLKAGLKGCQHGGILSFYLYGVPKSLLFVYPIHMASPTAWPDV